MAHELSSETRFALAVGAIFPDATRQFDVRLADGDWRAALELVRKPHRLEMLEQWWREQRVSVEDLRLLLPAAWDDAVPGSELHWWPLFRDAGYCGEPLPDGDPVIGYRGGQPGDPVAMVWALDHEKAARSALRWPRAAATSESGVSILAGEIVTAEVPCAKIVAHLTGPNGADVIAHPRSVRIVGRERVERPLS